MTRGLSEFGFAPGNSAVANGVALLSAMLKPWLGTVRGWPI